MHRGRVALEQRELPQARRDIVTHEVDVTVVPAQLEIAVVGPEPLIEHFRHREAAVPEAQHARSLLATMPGVAFDFNREHRVVHAIDRSAMAWPGVAYTSAVPDYALLDPGVLPFLAL